MRSTQQKQEGGISEKHAAGFPCTSCGQCCRNMGMVIKNQHMYTGKITEFIKDFPYDVRDDGSCSMLDGDSKCSVYSERPDICNIDKMFELVHKDNFKDKDTFYKTTAKACNAMIEKEGLPPEYFVEIAKK